ncbi:glycosyltransferase [Nocardioides sp. TRM66260-LWL]|uniref:glycosyltransferase family 2 protein n=1 Tax=Nocardioides sp. TRM66260-LWL TaxID=2874478 RepID=UPI001CC5B105|nr:glycosyltransferase [Nocardioides sp. TRM66260-LWL]MBZ5735820.1 glycosyltransferase [Nocardioides sp. TRM66260-LWL]
MTTLERPEAVDARVVPGAPLPDDLVRTLRGLRIADLGWEGPVLRWGAAPADVELARLIGGALPAGGPGQAGVATGEVVEVVALGEAELAALAPEPDVDPRLLAGSDGLAVTRRLLDLRLVAPADVAVAVAEHLATGDPVAEILVSREAVSQDVHTAVLADLAGLPRVDLTDAEVDLDVARSIPASTARRLGAVPLARRDDAVLAAVGRPLTPEAADELATLLQARVIPLLTPRTAIDQLVQRVHRDDYAHQAPRMLLEQHPGDSAHIVATTGQKVGLVLFALAVVVCAILAPMATAIGAVGVCSVVYLAVSLYRFRLTYRALGHRLERDVTAGLEHLDERTLPLYTVFVPLYKEAGIVRRLVRDLNALDYPRTRLDVKLLCEEDDEDTIRTIRSLDLPPHFSLVVVPDSQPKTKPKACNYGLLLADGEYCVIYDAEDRPDPDQLKKAVVAFRGAGPEIACIQGKLNYFNGRQNMLTSWFANEYSMHYELLLPAMGADRVPIPLGGTSNHFLTQVLRDLGAWDPYNVTEDADLGIRLHKAGYRTEIMDSTTLEEANSQLPNWVRQRSRWIKGYMQTWLVHMRRPVSLLRSLGLKGFLSFNLTVGGAYVHLINPIFWALTTLYLLTQADLIQALFPGFVFYAAATMLFVGNFVFVFLNVAGSLQRGQYELTRYALISPLYWGLMSLAAWKGFIQLFTNPFYWEKTEHGLNEEEHA